MKRSFCCFVVVLICVVGVSCAVGRDAMSEQVSLPDPVLDGSLSLEQALLQRRSVRSYADRPLTLELVSQLLWSAQGITDARRGLRTAPSAGATYPLELLLVVGRVEGMEAGVYRYKPRDHVLTSIRSGDVRPDLARASLGQAFIGQAPVSIVFTGVHGRTARRYGDRAERYVAMEAGHAAQNVYLQAVALELGTVVVGAFRDRQVADLLQLDTAEIPLYIMPVGYVAEQQGD